MSSTTLMTSFSSTEEGHRLSFRRRPVPSRRRSSSRLPRRRLALDVPKGLRAHERGKDANDDGRTTKSDETMIVPKLVGVSLGAAVVATIVASGGSTLGEVRGVDMSRAFSTNIERDPVRSFSVYGDVSKEYKVNKYDDLGRIVGRTRGVSVTSCAQLVPQEEETSSRGRPTKTDDDDDDFRACDVTAQPLEKVETAADIAPSCDAACRRSCREATKKYDRDQKKRFGFGFDAEEEGKVVRACGKQCSANCMKGGTGRYDFLIPFRF